MNNPVNIKPAPHGLYTKHTSDFICGVLLGDYRESWVVPLLRINTLYGGFCPVYDAGCCFQNNVLCVWFMYSQPSVSQ